MQLRRTAILLAYVFLIGLTLHVGALAYLRTADAIRPARFTSLLLSVLTAYSAPCGTLFAGLFASAKSAGRRRSRGGTATAAILLSVLWNSVLLTLTMQFTFGSEGDADVYGRQIVEVGAASGFMVTAAITYAIGNENEVTPTATR